MAGLVTEILGALLITMALLDPIEPPPGLANAVTVVSAADSVEFLVAESASIAVGRVSWIGKPDPANPFHPNLGIRIDEQIKGEAAGEIRLHHWDAADPAPGERVLVFRVSASPDSNQSSNRNHPSARGRPLLPRCRLEGWCMRRFLTNGKMGSGQHHFRER